MTIVEYIIQETQAKADEAFRYMAAVPEDKVEWKPLDAGRSIIDMARECAKCPDWAYGIVANEPPAFDAESMAETHKEMSQWTTVADCKEQCSNRLARLFGLYRGLTPERLAETKWLPFAGGRDFTMYEIMEYPHWNFNWHAGQAAYVQTLYGDKEMY